MDELGSYLPRRCHLHSPRRSPRIHDSLYRRRPCQRSYRSSSNPRRRLRALLRESWHSSLRARTSRNHRTNRRANEVRWWHLLRQEVAVNRTGILRGRTPLYTQWSRTAGRSRSSDRELGTLSHSLRSSRFPRNRRRPSHLHLQLRETRVAPSTPHAERCAVRVERRTDYRAGGSQARRTQFAGTPSARLSVGEPGNPWRRYFLHRGWLLHRTAGPRSSEGSLLQPLRLDHPQRPRGAILAAQARDLRPFPILPRSETIPPRSAKSSRRDGREVCQGNASQA